MLKRRVMPLTAQDITDLYDRHAEAMLAFLVRRTWNPEAAVDILAESFATAFEARRQFRGEDSQAALAWLHGIARHQLADYFRRQQVQRRALARMGIELRSLTDVEYDRIEELAGSRELRDSVARQVDALPQDQREAVRLRVVGEETYECVAHTLGISQDTARARVSRGLRALRVALDGAATDIAFDLERSADRA
jgi:RNA polymerase sigma-70 factor (ECF subfamily)